jgi:hypothetical protein
MEINSTILNILKDKKIEEETSVNTTVEIQYKTDKKSTFTSSISNQLKQEKDIRKQNYDVEIDQSENYQKIHSDLNYLDCCLDLDLVTCPIVINDNLWYCLICATLPLFANISYNLQLDQIKKLKERLAYDLDEKMLYDRYNYKRLVKKSAFQNKLLNNENIFGPIIRQYFSDYFNVNIYIIYENLIVETTVTDNDNPNIFLLSQYPKLSIITINNGWGLFNKLEAGHILENFPERINTLKPVAKYKLDELKTIAEQLKIPLTEKMLNKDKRRKKLDLYTDICQKLSYC